MHTISPKFNLLYLVHVLLLGLNFAPVFMYMGDTIVLAVVWTIYIYIPYTFLFTSVFPESCNMSMMKCTFL